MIPKKLFKRQLNFITNFIHLLRKSLWKIFTLLFFLVLLFFQTYNKLFYKFFFPYIISDKFIVDEREFINLIENITIKESETDNNISCYSTYEKLFWNNQKELDIEKLREEIKNRKNSRISFENKAEFYKRSNPKISLIITIYNQGYYIKTLYAFIQKQELKDIEIIFIDDASIDNSPLIINHLMKFDKRIRYLRNSINKRQFYSICIGILNSKGEYILSIDPDDLILNNILLKAYKTAKYYNLDILQFYMLSDYSLWKAVKYINGTLCSNSKIRNIFYYGKTRNLPDKLIRKDIYIQSIKFMKKEFYELDYHIHTDNTLFFGIIHFARSYGFLEQIGYFYNQEPIRRRNNNKNKDFSKEANENLKSLFNIMKYFIVQSDNNTIEKNNIPYKFFEDEVKIYIDKVINFIDKEFDFYIEVLNLFLDCSFFSKEKKIVVKKYKDIMFQQQIKVNTKF